MTIAKHRKYYKRCSAKGAEIILFLMWAVVGRRKEGIQNTSKIRRHLCWVLKDGYVLTSRGKKRVHKQKQKYKQRNDEMKG